MITKVDPSAKVEDAFKRVRLNVRLDSRGEQVPWESTSLEEDVYLFPTARQQLTETQRESRLDEELSHWYQVRSTANGPNLSDGHRLDAHAMRSYS